VNIDIQKLIEARVSSGLSLEEIEKKSNVSRTTLWRIEKGLSKPSAKTLSRLCDVYDKAPSYFLKGRVS